MITGAAASWRMLPGGRLERVSLPAIVSFSADLPRFVGLSLAVAASGAAQYARQATWRAGAVPPPHAGQAGGAEPKMPSRQAA